MCVCVCVSFISSTYRTVGKVLNSRRIESLRMKNFNSVHNFFQDSSFHVFFFHFIRLFFNKTPCLLGNHATD